MPLKVPTVTHLFSPLDKLLVELLESLSPEEWHAQTIAKRWKVKDVAAHLLDGNIRALSLQRDRYFGTPGPPSTRFQDVVDWINQFNNDWVEVARRISPDVMILLHKATGKLTSEYFSTLDLAEKSIFPVDWAGEKESNNKLHVAREYTEKWLHQQQIRDAVNKQSIMTKDYFLPFIRIFLCALPFTYRDIKAEPGTIIRITITGEAGGSWDLVMQPGGWEISEEIFNGNKEITSEVILDPHIAWKLFSKSLRPNDVIDQINIRGDFSLGKIALNMVSVMA